MELFIQKFSAKSIMSIDPREAMSRKDLNRLLVAGKTRNDIRKELFQNKVRCAFKTPNFDAALNDGSPTATERVMVDYLRRLAPFILSELAHLASAFIVDDELSAQLREQPLTARDIDLAEEVLRRKPSTYLEFSRTSLQPGHSKYLRAVVITKTTATGSKWSAIVEEPEASRSLVLTWYIVDGEVRACESVVATDTASSGGDGGVKLYTSVTGLVYACLATWSAVAAQGMVTLPTDVSALPAVIGGTAAARASVEVAGCEFRIERLKARNQLPSAVSHLGDGKKLERHIKVQGHWKSVACGKGRLMRRDVWIPSYHKGPRHLPLSTKVPLFTVKRAV